jgi:hypothetical protein
MAPEKQEAASQAYEELGLPENTEVGASLRPALLYSLTVSNIRCLVDDTQTLLPLVFEYKLGKA